VKNIFKFPFLSMPDKNKIIEALQDLKELKAIESHKQLNTEDATEITQLGRVLISIPLLPKYSKILLTGRSEDVFIFLYSFYNQILLYTLLLVCVLSVEEILKRDSF
jgi:HrpA-like RNA helicase